MKFENLDDKNMFIGQPSVRILQSSSIISPLEFLFEIKQLKYISLSIKVSSSYLNVRRLFENLAIFSSRYLHELHLSLCHTLFSEVKIELEKFIINWKYHAIPLSLIIEGSYRYAHLFDCDEIIEKI
jgi:hypothetical protein